MQERTSRTRNFFHKNPERFVVFAFLFSLFLITPLFVPTFLDLGPFDEMIHVNTGRELVEGELKNIPGHPLVSLLYAITYLPVAASPYWFLWNVTLGRVLLFCMTWWAAYLVAKQLADLSPPLIATGILLVSPATSELFLNPPDALFAAMSGFTLWQMLRYLKTKQSRYLFSTSCLAALATFARLDGLILAPVILLVVLLQIFLSNEKLRSRLNWIAVSIVPYLGILLGYQLLFGLITGDSSFGIGRYTYFSFRAGHQTVFQSDTGVTTSEAIDDADRVFGTPTETQSSFLVAIRRNPEAYLDRLRVIVSNLPSDLVEAYGKRLSVVLFLLAARGFFNLIRQKKVLLAATFTLWPTHLLAYTIIGLPNQAHYLRMPFFIVVSLASLGLHVTLSNSANKTERGLLTLLFVICALYGVLDNKLAIYVGASIFLVALWIAWHVRNSFSPSQTLHSLALIVTLCAGFIIRGPYPSPGSRQLGSRPEDKLVRFLAENLEQGSRVIAYAPGFVLAARLEPAQFTSEARELESGEALRQWLLENDIRAVYSSHMLRTRESKLWRLIEMQLDQGLERVFREDPGDHQIILVHDSEP
jgi:hypothetical protein